MSAPRQAVLYAVFALSGAAGLGYQMVWVRAFGVGLGHEMPCVLAVVAAVFAGLALGAWRLDSLVARCARPGLLYAGLELVIGLWSIASTELIDFANGLALHAMGLTPHPLWQWSVVFLLPGVALLPATFAMGATLPAMERYLAAGNAAAHIVPALYALNTAGAVAGTLAATFALVPAFGYDGTLLALGGVNFLCAAIAAVAAHQPPPGAPRTAPLLRLPHRLAVTLFATGLLGIGLEVLVVRVLSQVFEGSVYSYAAVLAVFLAGTAAGAAGYQRWGMQPAFDRVQRTFLYGLATAGLLSVPILSAGREIYRWLRLQLGEGIAAMALAELGLSAVPLAAPTLLMGALFAHLAQRARAPGGGLGRAVAANAAGGALAPVLFGVILLPVLGARWSIALCSLSYLLLLLPVPPRQAGRAALAALLAAVLVAPWPLRIVSLRPGEWVVEHREGVMSSLAVVGRNGERNLRVDNRYQMGGTGAEAVRIQRQQTHIPMRLHPHPRRALYLGVASGVTVGASASYPGLAVDATELVPEVLELLYLFSPENGSPQHAASIRLFAMDARRFVRASSDRYDVVIGDLFHPVRDGTGMLYTREHFEAVRARLADGGVFCQWLPLYQLDTPMLGAIVGTFLEVFPDAEAYLAAESIDHPALGLVGYRDAAPAADPAVLATFIADAPALRLLAAGMRLNTDDRPVVVFGAPAFNAKTPPGPAERMAPLFTLRSAQRILPRAAAQLDAAGTRELAAALQARDRRLRAALDQRD